MAIIKIEELNAVSELTAAELSLTKGGHHDECGCGSLIYISDPDVIDNKGGRFTINEDGNINVLGVLVEVEESGNGNKLFF
ncbi:MAG: hypothetical protein HC866_08290 [Leptolyngbyaceae cyanobacterium RU_5_1]|nr:hypothetical protein [Leptolyngbyaceae cyanobacterium RU_5_1]